MNRVMLFLITIGLLSACGQKQSTTISTTATTQQVQIEYPEQLAKVFEHHGSLSKWQMMKSMEYDIVKPEGYENQKIDLQTRIERIKSNTFESGYDGKDYWVLADTSYKGNPKFYTNLIFYFYAMPFVLADDGIIYTESEPIYFEEKTYPGYRISYNSGVGISPEDEYFIHYDPETYEMAWLGYTVTFYSGKKSDRIKWIRYDDWKNFNDLKLPSSITWYNTEDGRITDIKKKREFTNIKVSDSSFSIEEMSMPDGAKIFE